MKRHTKGNFHQTAAPLLFLLPNILIFGTFIIIPAIQGLRMSFTEWGVFTTPVFIGFDNFIELIRQQPRCSSCFPTFSFSGRSSSSRPSKA